jgi:hypothetical protein
MGVLPPGDTFFRNSPPHQLFHILGKPPHQQIEIKNEVIFFHIIDQLNPIVLAFSFLLQYSCKDNACGTPKFHGRSAPRRHFFQE